MNVLPLVGVMLALLLIVLAVRPLQREDAGSQVTPRAGQSAAATDPVPDSIVP
jgi:biopolymer transport protein ExbD